MYFRHGFNGNGVKMVIKSLTGLMFATLIRLYLFAQADDTNLWGVAEKYGVSYKPQKVLYDLTIGKKDIQNILHRAILLFKLKARLLPHKL